MAIRFRSLDSPSPSDRFDERVESADQAVHRNLTRASEQPGLPNLGWMNVTEWSGPEVLSRVLARAAEIRRESEVLVVIGVGGSNQAARAVIAALEPGLAGLPVEWAGTNLSADYQVRLLRRLAGRNAHFVVIAKNFETLEPGLGFRLSRDVARRSYGPDYARRFTVIGSAGSSLESLARSHAMTFLEFPSNIGGRFTALTTVGLLPMAVAGVDIEAVIRGGQTQQQLLAAGDQNATEYAATRFRWLLSGRSVEGLAFFEPALARLGAWWVQLFAESEGKDRRGLFPVPLNYSEQLHSVGQYIQEGQPIMAETFLELATPPTDILVPQDGVADGFGYLDRASLNRVNATAFESTVRAHAGAGVPGAVITMPALDAVSLGAAFYFFCYAVAVSGALLEINPYDQPGVEAYKSLMFALLGREQPSPAASTGSTTDNGHHPDTETPS